MTDQAVGTTDVATSFVARLDGLVARADRARLAALRQLVMPEERWRPDVYAAAYPLVPPHLHPNDERRFLLVAGLHALWHRGTGVPATHSGANFGASMRVLAGRAGGAESSAAVERRFAVLLASEDERLAHHLRQTVTQLSSSATNVDFAVLLADLRYWDHPDRFVQRRWAHEFWTSSAPVADGKASA